MASNIRHAAPTLTINEVKGWTTRLLYNYYGNWDYGDGSSTYAMHYEVETSNDFTQNIFTAINSFQTTIGYPVQKGIYSFPAKYFVSGKSIRIEGWLRITTVTSRIFNMKAKIDNTNSGIIEIARTNDNNSHTLAAGNAVTDLPVYFKIVYTAIEDDSPLLSMTANGHYQYEYVDYNAAGNNTSVVYVPIHNGYKHPKGIGSSVVDNSIYISFDGSDVDELVLVSMTMEELS